MNLIVNNNESNTKYYIIMTSLDDDEISESYNGEKTYNEFCNVIRTNLELNISVKITSDFSQSV